MGVRQMLFSEIYGSYFNVVAAVLSEAAENTLTTGKLTAIVQTCRFIADVYDASEMLPWIRTFIGRIVDLQCNNKFVVKTFNDDLRHMEAIYGGETDAV